MFLVQMALRERKEGDVGGKKFSPKRYQETLRSKESVSAIETFRRNLLDLNTHMKRYFKTLP